MPSKRRKFEFHILTISGLAPNTDYISLIRSARAKFQTLGKAVWEHSGKSHALERTNQIGDTLRLTFLSYKTGYRPDILDTADYSIEPNPLSDTQTGVDYTHVVIKKIGRRWMLVTEKTQGGIYPNTIGQYLNWMLDTAAIDSDLRQGGEAIVVNVEPDPGKEFISRIDTLDRIMKASIRIVRPNPGWADLESELSKEAATSDAAHADLAMSAKPRSTLKKNVGIIAHIKSLFRKKELGHAAIVGSRDGQEDKFTTSQMGRSVFRNVPLDENGQVIGSEAFTRMESALEEKRD